MIDTISQCFLNTVKTYVKNDLMLYKKEGRYVPISTEEFKDRVKYFALGLKDLGLKAGDKLNIISETRPEWVMADIGNLCLGGITVPIYTTLVAEQVKYIIKDSDAKVVIFADLEQWKKIKAVKSELSKVSHYITFLSEAPEGVLTFSQVMERGKRVDQANPGLFEKLAADIKPCLLYTSDAADE